MKDVYQNATLTIAATGAKDSTVGLYFQRKVDLLVPVSIHIRWAGLPQSTYQVFDDQLWEENIEKAPLNRRAWVVQERLLSRRTVHFGQDQIAWECQQSRACEIFPDEVPIFFLPRQDLRFTTTLRHQSSSLASTIWPKIAEVYCPGQLTQEADKCIAISGIAEEIHACTGDAYIAGMWRSCFVPQMCWTTHRLNNRDDDIVARRPSRYRAPSWSWLSMDSHISFYDFDDGKIGSVELVFDILDIEIQNTRQSVFGSIRSGQIVGCGMLRPGKYEMSKENGRVLTLGDKFIKYGAFWNHNSYGQFTMDVVSDEGHVHIWCLPLLVHHIQTGYSSDDPRYIGIILVETGEKKNEYKRIGCFQFDDSLRLGDDFFLLRGGSRHNPAYSVFTIV